jgi:diaminohydroxyphosphoribosylaminopyrimidine deaminase/5-amino-6-(5-phosphoribosylamino)uracil reductase
LFYERVNVKLLVSHFGVKILNREKDIQFTKRALELAAQGIGQVSPSPLVGCVIVTDKGKVVGEGFYIYDNIKHAEVIALEQAGEKARGATAYISLEPHAHHGRTPPCTDALINAGIKRVVCPIEDPNPLVSGKGFQVLREAGLQVDVGLMEKEADRLNEKYNCFFQKQRPFVHLKMASSLDGKIATRAGDSRWITGEASLNRVHEMRHEYDAILIGSGTAITDDPLLTDRSGKTRRRKLVRVVLDSRLRLPLESQLAQTADEIPTIVFTDSQDREKIEALQKQNVEIVFEPSGGRDLNYVFRNLCKRDLQSVFVEGGAQITGAFLDAGMIDKVSFFIAPMLIGGKDSPTAIGGVGAMRLANAMRLHDVGIKQHGDDIEVTGYPG